MSEEKSVKEQAQELAKEIAAGISKEIVAAIKTVKDAETEEKETEVETKTISFESKIGYVSKDVAFDRAVDKHFDPENVKSVMGEQTEQKMIDKKNALFVRAIVGMKAFPHDPRFAATVKALSEGTNADGGYLVNPEYRGEVIRQMHLVGVMRPEVNVIPTTKDTVLFNKEDGRPSVSWGTENTTISTTTAGLAQTSISVYRMNTLMYLSREVVADSDPAILDWIRTELATAMALEEDAVIIGGSGSGRPTGLNQLSLATNNAGAALTFEDYVDLEFTLPVQYRTGGNAKYYMSSLTLRDALKLKDNENRPIYIQDMSGKTPGTLMGRAVVVHDNFAEGEIYFGDLKRSYFLLDRQEMSLETTTEGGDTFAKHQVGIKVTQRIGGNAVRTEALVKGTGYSQ